VFENGVLRIFGPKKDKVAGDWRKLHNEELHNFYSSPCIIVRMIKSSRMRLAGHVARMGEECMQDFGGKTRRRETIRNTST
jgi:hypothetical protein